MRWFQEGIKPLPTCGAGAFARRPRRLPFGRGVGALFPQPAVGAANGRPARLDDALPAGWVALAREPGAAGALRVADVPVLEVGADLADPAGALAAWLDRHRVDWVVLRPDRYVFACGERADVPAVLTALLSLRPS